MSNYLDPDNDVHMWCLHLVYLPMINKHLETWKAAWIHHPIRTEKNKSPMQLWISGLHMTNFGQTVLSSNVQEPLTEDEFNQYGIDWDGPVNTESNNFVEVPDTTCPLDNDNLQVLMQQIDITVDDGNYGIYTFNDTVAKVTNLLRNQR